MKLKLWYLQQQILMCGKSGLMLNKQSNQATLVIHMLFNV